MKAKAALPSAILTLALCVGHTLAQGLPFVVPGVYQFANRVLDSNGNTLAVTFNGANQEAPLLLPLAVGNPQQQWTVKAVGAAVGIFAPGSTSDNPLSLAPPVNPPGNVFVTADSPKNVWTNILQPDGSLTFLAFDVNFAWGINSTSDFNGTTLQTLNEIVGAPQQSWIPIRIS